MDNELYQSPFRNDFTCSSLTSSDYVPFSGDLTPVHQDFTPVYLDFMPVHQDITPVHQDLKPIYQDSKPVYKDSTPVYQDLIPVCQDFMPASQDLPIVKNIFAASDSFSEVHNPFISEGLVSLLHDKVNNRKAPSGWLSGERVGLKTW